MTLHNAEHRESAWGSPVRIAFNFLSFLERLRHRNWAGAIYFRLPLRIRQHALAALALPARRRAKFPCTAALSGLPAQAPALLESRDQEKLRLEWAGGVNVFAYFRGEFGIAESARLYTRALMHVGYPVSLYHIDNDLPHSMNDSTLEAHLGRDTPFAVNLVFVNPDNLAVALEQIGRARLAKGYIIACWFWELEQVPPEWLPALALVDEVLVASSFVEEAFRRVTDKPISRIPLPLIGSGDSGLTRADFGLEEHSYIFLVTFDFNSWVQRKNPLAAIRAFRAAFPPEQAGVQLLVKSSNGNRYPLQFMRLMAAAENDSRILVRDEVLNRDHVQALQRCADAYLSLHRAEGFGLGLAESMWLGKPVVATAWSGNLDFMGSEDSCLVPYTMVPIGPDEYLHCEGQRWAEADVLAAAEKMRALAGDPDFSASIGQNACRRVRQQLDPGVVGKALAARLTDINKARQSRVAPVLEATP